MRVLSAQAACFVFMMVFGLAQGPAQADTIEMIDIKGGRTVSVQANGVRVALTFSSVVSDERCPARVTCSWANPPVVQITATADNHPRETFTLSARGPRPGSYAGLSIQYADLTPAPQDTHEFSVLKPLEAYTVRLRIVAR